MATREELSQYMASRRRMSPPLKIPPMPPPPGFGEALSQGAASHAQDLGAGYGLAGKIGDAYRFLMESLPYIGAATRGVEEASRDPNTEPRAWDIAGIDKPGEMPKAATIIGPNSPSFPHLFGRAAQEDLEAGRDPKEIWREWGIEHDPIRGPVSEISDRPLEVTKVSPNVLKLGEPETAPLSESVSHPPLFEAYPGMADVQYRAMQKTMGGDHAVYKRSENTADPAAAPEGEIRATSTVTDPESIDSLRGLTAHEVQHKVQEIEDWPRGGTKRELGMYNRGKAIVQDARRQYLARIKAGEDPNDPELARLAELGSKRDDSYSFVGYESQAGEVQARNVADRMNLEPKERGDTPPSATEDFPRNLQTVTSQKTPIVVAREQAAEQRAEPKLSKKALADADAALRTDRLRRTIEKRGFVPGENRQPFINPDREELARIRAEHGESGITGKLGTEMQVDPSQTAHLFPEPSARTREQKPLIRTERAEMTPRMADMAKNPAVKEAIRRVAEMGRDKQSWYDTTPLQQIFHKEFGPEEGQQRFQDFIGMIAATSTDNPLGQNIRTGSNYYSQKYGGGRQAAEEPYVRKLDVIHQMGPNKGQPKEQFPVPGYEVPPELYGSQKQQTHISNVNQFEQTGGFDPKQNPKIAAFFENLMGNWMPATVDKHAVRAAAMATKDPRWLSDVGQAELTKLTSGGMSPEQAIEQLYQKGGVNWADIPDTAKGEYAGMEQIWNETAAEMGVTPAELQAMAWIGGGGETGLKSPRATFMESFADRIRRTALRDNIPPEQVLQLMLHGKLTLAQLEQSGAPGTSAIG